MLCCPVCCCAPPSQDVAGSRCWPLISRYRASVRTQSPKVEMIDSLFKPLDDGKDDGIIRDCCRLWYCSSKTVRFLHVCSCWTYSQPITMSYLMRLDSHQMASRS